MGAGEDTRGWRRVGVLRPLEIRDFRLLWSGLTISLIGDGIFFVALPWQVLELSNSPTAIALVGLVWTVPMVAASAARRRDRRPLRPPSRDADRRCRPARRECDARRAVGHGQRRALARLCARCALRRRRSALLPRVQRARARDRSARSAGPGELARRLRPTSRRAAPRPGARWHPDRRCERWQCSAGRRGVVRLLDRGAAAHAATPRARDELSATRVAAEIREGFRFVRSRTWLWGTLVCASVALLVYWGPWEALLPFLVKTSSRRAHAASASCTRRAGPARSWPRSSWDNAACPPGRSP